MISERQNIMLSMTESVNQQTQLIGHYRLELLFFKLGTT